jgi:transposase-like protein
VLREMIKRFAQRMMDADMEIRCNAGYGKVTPERVNSRNGAASVRARHAQVVTALEAKFPQAAAHLDEARDDILAFTGENEKV